jgi:hypothetical protein
LTRRQLIELVAASAASAATPRIRSARLGTPIRLEGSGGDTWIAAWADDDDLYVSSDDTSGFGNKCGSNLAMNRIRGGSMRDLHGETINCMKEYGGGSETRKEDGGMWKACGFTCVDGVLYLAVSRHLTCPTEPDGRWEGRYSPFPIQEAWDSSIVKSADHGKTWSRMPELGRSMFPGKSFGTPYFVHYGKDGAGTANGANEFIYATSNDGAWNNGNWMTLGRVRKDRIARLDPRDWEFVQGFDDKRNPIWQPGHADALYTFRNPGRTSMAGIHYVAGLDLYILPQWYYTHLDDPNRRWDATRWEFYSASTPWGPWTLFHAQDFEPEGWYNACIPSKLISADGRKMCLFTAGNFIRKELGCYGLWMMEFTLDV